MSKITREEFESILKRLNLSKKDFAKEIGVTAGAVSNWFKPDRSPPEWVGVLLRCKLLLAAYRQVECGCGGINHEEAERLVRADVELRFNSEHIMGNDRVSQLNCSNAIFDLLLQPKKSLTYNHAQSKAGVEKSVEELNSDPEALEMLTKHDEENSGFRWEKGGVKPSYLASKILRELEELKKEVEELKKEKGKDDQ